MKERLGLTEIRKQANRMSFGEVGPLTLAPLSHFFLSAGHHPTSSLSPTSVPPAGTNVALSARPIPPPSLARLYVPIPRLPLCCQSR